MHVSVIVHLRCDYCKFVFYGLFNCRIASNLEKIKLQAPNFTNFRKIFASCASCNFTHIIIPCV